MPENTTERETRIEDGIEWFSFTRHDGHQDEDCQCARCGSSCGFLRCGNCDEDGFSHHDCGEDCCCCRYPENNVRCDWCKGAGGWWNCLSTPEFCNAHPLPGRDHIKSSALNSEAWGDY